MIEPALRLRIERGHLGGQRDVRIRATHIHKSCPIGTYGQVLYLPYLPCLGMFYAICVTVSHVPSNSEGFLSNVYLS